MSDNTIILAERQELIISQDKDSKPSTVKQVILDEVMGEIDKMDEVDWRDLEPFLDKEKVLCGFRLKNGGKIIIEPRFDDFWDFENGFAGVKLNEKWGYIKQDGSYLIEPKFYFAFEFKEGFACVKLNDKWGYIKTDGLYLEEPKFDGVWNFSEGFAGVLLDNKCGFIKQDGSYLYPFH